MHIAAQFSIGNIYHWLSRHFTHGPHTFYDSLALILRTKKLLAHFGLPFGKRNEAQENDFVC